MINIILSVILLIIVGFAVWYICKERKQGNRCIGCPNAKNCAKNKCNFDIKDC